MRTLRSLCSVLFLGVSSLLHAETNSYPASFAQIPEITLDMPAGTTAVTLPAEVGAAYLNATNKRVWRTQARAAKVDYLTRDATPDNAYDEFGVPSTFVTYALSDAQGTRQSWFAAVEAAHDGGTQVELLVGIDANGDGLPQASEEICRIGVELYDSQRCLLDLRGRTDHPLWAFAHIIGPFGTPYPPSERVHVSIATADFQLSSNGTRVSVAPSSDFLFVPNAGNGTGQVAGDFSYRPDVEQASSEPFEAIGGLLLTAADDALSSATVWPLRVEFTPLAQTDRGRAIAARYDSFDEVKVVLQPNQTYNGLYADNPNQDSLGLVVLNRDAAVFVWFEPFPAASPDSRAAPAAPPPGTRGILLWPGALPAAPNHERICSGCPSDMRVANGRLHFSVRNMNPIAPISLRMRVKLARSIDFATRQAPGLFAPSGNYYNPLRSGDGVFLDLVNQLQVFYWYTFDQNGQPVWYTASAEPSYENGAVGTFNTTLYRIRERAGRPRDVVPVGRIVLTAAGFDPRELMFSWSIDGETGSNRIQLAIAPRCTQQATGLQYNLTGHWFNPFDPHWGTNLLGLRQDFAEGLYLFDGAGDPRWVFGILGPNNGAWSGALYQFKGACPTCDYVAPTHTPVGHADINFSSSTEAQANYVVNFAQPLSGSFTRTAATIRRATSAVECSMQP